MTSPPEEMPDGYPAPPADDRWEDMHQEVSEEQIAAGPARSITAVFISAAGSTLLFWWVGRSTAWSMDLQVAFLVTAFGLILAVTVGYSWTMDRVWRRTHRAADSALAAFKGDFVAGVSHELRTALTGIVGFAQLVDARLLGDDNAEAINAVVGQSVELSRVVDDLVARARLDFGGMAVAPQPIPVVAQVRPAVGFVEVMGAKVEIACEEADVLVDPEAFRHLLRNLLINAHRHGLPPLSVRGRSYGDRYICQVVDGGAGVSSEQARDLFRSDRTAGRSRPDAVGVGLSVAKDLAAAMGCDLSYRHIRGETHFVLTVPLAPSHRHEGRQPAPSSLSRVRSVAAHPLLEGAQVAVRP